MSQKPIRFCLLFLLCAFCLYGCGYSKTPYLSEEQKASVERELFDSLRLEYFGSPNRYLEVSLKNNSKYDLADFFISFPALDMGYTIKNFPVGQEAEFKQYIQRSDAAGTEQVVFLSYTIGAYKYKSSEVLYTVEERSPIEIIVKTTNGDKVLGIGDSLDLNNGTEIEGTSGWNLSSFSVTGSVNGKNYTILLNATGEEPSVSRTDLVCKVKDENNSILWTGYYWYSQGKVFISGGYSTQYQPGKYEVVFEEIKG